MDKILYWSLILLLLFSNTSFSQSDIIQSDCISPRLVNAENIRLENLEIGETYKFVFPHNTESFDLISLFNQSDVKSLTYANNDVYFAPVISDINFSYPGLHLDEEIVNCNEFHIKKIKGSIIKSMMGVETVSGATPEFLINNVLLGDFCLDVSNINNSGTASTRGTFSNGMSSIGIEDGLILATGNIEVAEGPNTGNYTATGGSNSPDPDIAQITAGLQRDVVKLEFDFVPDESTIQFDYVFASEEYCFYVNSAFNDAFGFFLSGPGINGTFTNNAINIATLPDGTPVSINNVNFVNTPNEYVTNTIGGGGGCTAAEVSAPKPFLQLTGFNGFTIPLVAEAEVTPCETYHIKIVISDIGDGLLDSGVFLGSTSFVSGEADSRVNLTTGTVNDDNDIADEGCENAYIAFEKDPPENAITFTFDVLPTSTATQGVDYESFPATYTIPAGVSFDTLWIDVYADLLAEGIEDVQVRIIGLCDCLDPIVEFQIEDPPIYDRNFSICEGDFYDGPDGPIFNETEFLEVVESPDGCDTLFRTSLMILPKTYLDTTIYRCFGEPLEFNGETIEFAPALEVFILDDANLNSCDSVIQLNFQWLEPIVLAAIPDTLSCENGTVQLSSSNANLPDNISYYWIDPSGNIIEEEQPFVNIPGIYQLIAVIEQDDQLCENFFPVEVEVIADSSTPLVEDIDDIVIYCGTNASTVYADVLNEDIIPNVQYQWNGPNGFTSDADSIMPIDSGTYYLEVISPSSGCVVYSSFEVEYETVIPQVEFITNSLGCNVTDLPLLTNVDLEGGTYSWTGPNGFSSDEQVPVINEPGNYVLEYFISSICIAVDSVEIEIDNTLPDINSFGDTIICNQGFGELGFDSEDITDFFWEGPNGFYSTDTILSVNEEGVYTIQVEGANGCINTESVILQNIDILPDITTSDNSINCDDLLIELNLSTEDVGLTYDWQGPNGFTSADQNPTTNESGEYYITVTNLEGCVITDQLSVSIDTLSPDISVSDKIIDCENAIVILESISSTDIISFSWVGPNSITGDSNNLETDFPGNYELVVTSANGCTTSVTSTILIDTIAPLISTLGDTLDCNTSLGELEVDFSNSAFNISWLNSNEEEISTDKLAITNIAGVYTVIVTDTINGCSSTDFVEIFENSNTPEVDLIADTITCEIKDFTINTISSDAGLDYQWTGPNGFDANTESVIINEAGTYIVEVTSSIGCIVNKSITVSADISPPIIQVAPDTITCAFPSIFLNGFSINENDVFNWTGPNNFISDEKNPEITTGGMYVLTVMGDNFCTNEAVVEVFEDNQYPEIALSYNDTLNCNNNSIEISLDEMTGISSSYQWTGPNGFTSTSQSIDVNTAGIYFVNAIGENGCEVIETIEVFDDFSTINITTNDVTIDCNNPSISADVIYGSNDYSLISWTSTTGFYSEDPLPIFTEGGNYTVSIVGNNGCMNTANIIVTEDFVEPMAELQGDTISCAQSEIDIILVGNNSEYSFQWEYEGEDIFNTTSMITTNEAGNYAITVTDPENGCENTDQIEIFELADIADFEFETLDPNCMVPLGSINFGEITGGTSPFIYSIDGGATFQSSPVFNGINGGEYELVIEDSESCTDFDSTYVISLADYTLSSEELYVIFLGDSKQINVTTSVDPEDIDSIYWTPSAKLSCTNCLNPIVETLVDQIFTVTIIDKNGCELSTDIEIRVLETPYYIPNVFTPNGDGVNDFFSIFGELEDIEIIEEFRIYDRWGENVFIADDADPTSDEIKWFGDFKGESAQSGVYAYYIRYRLIDGKVYKRQGDVTIMR